MSTFTYKGPYGEYKDCYFQKGYYANGNLAIEIMNNELGPITKVTVNPNAIIPCNKIAVKDYSENEGMVEWLQSMHIIEKEPVSTIVSGWVEIPIYELTDLGLELFK